ncbi:MAG: AAA family ATPase [Anaerolineales bacterium]|nr:AAA family ATPase [Anaerolineales bacterium]
MTTPAVFSTGSLRLDQALVIGGIPAGHFIEVYGPESSGKTTLCLHWAAEAQRLGKDCAWIDTDGTLTNTRAAQCGVHPDHLWILEPGTAEQVLSKLEMLAESGAFAMIILDSLSTMLPEVEPDQAQDRGEQVQIARSLSQTLRQINPIIRRNGACLVFTNHPLSAKRSAAYHGLAKNPARLALKLQAAQRFELRPQRLIQQGRRVTGQQVLVRIIKNTFAPCYQAVELDIMYCCGVQITGEILDLGTQLQIIRQQGKVYSYRGWLLGKDRQEAIHFLNQNRPLAEDMKQIIRQRLFCDA